MESDRIKIIVEKNIPFFRGLLDDVAEVIYLAPEDITKDAVADTDAIVTRTRTKCNEQLLKGSKCRLIASATIGLDHVDVDWCGKNGIEVRNAPGCNAPAVAQYVFASLLALGVNLRGKCLGIIGAGHVGKIVAEWGRQLGMKVLVNDPPRQETEGCEGFVDLDCIAAEADIITFHTPYTNGPKYPTYHLLNSFFVEKLQRKPIVINSARGPVTDTEALLCGLKNGKISQVVIDCWEGEPDINAELLKIAGIATPHIAGYSLQGKKRASYIAAQVIAERFNLKLVDIPEIQYLPQYVTAKDIAQSYNPMDDTERLKANPGEFENLRNRYDLRKEVLFR